MSRLGKALRKHRTNTRTTREMNRAIDHAATPALRNELLTMAQVQGLPLR